MQKPASALLIVGHGSTVNADSSAPNWAHAAAIRGREIFADVQCAFWKEEPSMRDALSFFRDSAISDVYVVPNFISEGYFTQTVIPRELALSGTMTERPGGQLWKYCEPVGNHPAMTSLLLKRAAEVAPGVPREESTLLIVGHGTGLNDNSAIAAKREVARISERGEFAAVMNVYMEEAPLVSDWQTLTSTPNVIVVPFFISDGLHSYQDIPVLLGIEKELPPSASERARAGEVFQQNPRIIGGRRLYYASAIGTGAEFADLIVEQVETFDGQNCHLHSLT